MDNFNLLKFRHSLLEDYQDQGFESEDEMEDYYNDTDFINEKELKLKTAKQSNATNSINFAQNDDAGAGNGGAMEEGVEEGSVEGEIRDYFDTLIKNQPEDALNLIMDLIKGGPGTFDEWIDDIQYDIVDSHGGDYNGAIRGYREDELEEGQLEEMASFYKLTDNSPEAIAAIQAKKEKFKPGSTIYNTLDTLEKNGEIDYKALAKSTGKDMATYNNPKSREVLEKDLANYIQAGSAPKADKPKAEKSPKIKITTPKAEKPASTKLADLAPSSVFGGEGADEEEMDMEKQATKAAKGNKRLGTAAEKLAQISSEMKALVPAYQAAKGTPEEALIVAQLKDLTAEKKALEKKVYKAPKQMTAADLMGGEEA